MSDDNDDKRVVQLKTRSAVRAEVKSAAEILRSEPNSNPIEAARRMARFLESMSQRRWEEATRTMATIPSKEYDRIADTVKKAADIQMKLAEFVFTKW